MKFTQPKYFTDCDVFPNVSMQIMRKNILQNACNTIVFAI